MRIIQTSQELRTNLDQSCDLNLDLRLKGFYGEDSNSLPKTTAVLLNNKKLLNSIANSARRSGYKCPQDFLIAVVVPELQLHIQNFYASGNGRMNEILSPQIIERTDLLIETMLRTKK